VDQGIEIPRMPRTLRLLLTFLGVLFGMLVLGFVFGSSSASADEGPDAGGTLTGAVQSVVQNAQPSAVVAPVIAQVGAVVPLAPVLAPVTALVDTTVSTVTAALVPTLHVIEGFAPTGQDVLAVAPAASWIPVAAFNVAGDAIGSLDLMLSDLLGTSSVSASPSGAAPAAAVLGAGLFVLLMARRPLVSDGAVPASVVYDTDSSPD
jgi:hypothetical protein